MNAVMPMVLTRARSTSWPGALVLVIGGLTACGATEKPRPVAAEHPASVTSAPVVDPRAVASLAEGERQIEVAAGDCGSACAGVAKITQARIRLCSPRTSACADAEKRDDDATKQVASFCGVCPKVGP